MEVDKNLIITSPAVQIYPRFELSSISIGGDATKGHRAMSVSVPLFEVESGSPRGLWSYTFGGDEYNAAQSAFTSDVNLFSILCQKVGCTAIDLSNVAENQVNLS